MRRVVIIRIQAVNLFFTFCMFGNLQKKYERPFGLYLSLNSRSNNIYKRLGKKIIISRIEKNYNTELEKINCKNSIEEIKNYFNRYKILNIYEQYI